MVEDKDVTVLVVVTDDAADVSLIKSLLSREGDARVVICTIVSIEEDEGDREGSRHRCEKLPVRFYQKKQKKISFICNCVCRE
jgi:hypothetical protein